MVEFREVIAFERMVLADSDGDNVPTPPGICRFLYDLISPHYQPSVGLDPCAGLDNALSQPWTQTKWINFELRRGSDFFLSPNNMPDVELVLCNPPFSGGQARSFLLRILAIVRPGTPIVFICSALYFCNAWSHGPDYDWLLTKPPITSFILPPRNAWPGVAHPILIALLNMPKLQPWYPIPYDYLDR